MQVSKTRTACPSGHPAFGSSRKRNLCPFTVPCHSYQTSVPFSNAGSSGSFSTSKVAAARVDAAVDPNSSFSDVATRAVRRASRAVDRYGWTSFWIQLTLSAVSGIILLFSVAFTSQSGPKASLCFTVAGILAGFFSTFWSFSYTLTAKKLKALAAAPNSPDVPQVKKQQVVDLITKGVVISLVGFGSALAGVNTLVGGLMVSTLNNTSVVPLTETASSTVLALDVFLVQAATNTLLGHFLSLCCSLWLLYVLSENAKLKMAAA